MQGPLLASGEQLGLRCLGWELQASAGERPEPQRRARVKNESLSVGHDADVLVYLCGTFRKLCTNNGRFKTDEGRRRHNGTYRGVSTSTAPNVPYS